MQSSFANSSNLNLFQLARYKFSPYKHTKYATEHTIQALIIIDHIPEPGDRKETALKANIFRRKCTCDGNFCWPLGRSIQNTLFCCFCILWKVFFGNIKHFPDHFKHFRSIFLSNFHSFLHSTNNILCFIFCTMFGTFLSSSWNKGKDQYFD